MEITFPRPPLKYMVRNFFYRAYIKVRPFKLEGEKHNCGGGYDGSGRWYPCTMYIEDGPMVWSAEDMADFLARGGEIKSVTDGDGNPAMMPFEVVPGSGEE